MTLLLKKLLLPLLLLVGEGKGHGRLMDPPARNAMWRLGFPNPVNYNDNELFCGGFAVQQHVNGGRCGVCGDDWRLPVPRPHENGGLYGNGVIGRRYISGSEIEVNVLLTSNHQGHFIFRLCPAPSSGGEVDEACLASNVLKVLDPNRNGSSLSYKINSEDKSGSFDIQLRLPPKLTCSRCTFQWVYVTGNSWGDCGEGVQGGEGCGPQEHFINCADITILPSEFSGTLGERNPYLMYYRDAEETLTPLIISYQVCVGVGAHASVPGIHDWCQRSCLRYPPYCPPQICRCVEDCGAVGAWASGRKGADAYCLDQCSVYPPKRQCTRDKCSCW